LKDLDTERFQRVLALCRTYVAIYDRPEETDDVFASRLTQISPRNNKASA
jgi:hypothetical protein